MNIATNEDGGKIDACSSFRRDMSLRKVCTGLYDIKPPKDGSFSTKVQNWVLRKTGSGFPQISGVGHFGVSGFLPKPGDLTEVVGQAN